MTTKTNEDYHYLINHLGAERSSEINGKNYNLIRNYDIYAVFKYFFADNDESKWKIFCENFIKNNLIRHELIKVFFEDKDGLRKTEFNQLTKKFNGQKTKNVPKFISELYFCRESFFNNIDLIGLLSNTGHLRNADKELKLKILSKIKQVRPLYPDFVYDIIELKSIANREIFYKPLWWPNNNDKSKNIDGIDKKALIKQETDKSPTQLANIRWKPLNDEKQKIKDYITQNINTALKNCKDHIEIKLIVEKKFGTYKKGGKDTCFTDPLYLDTIKDALTTINRTDLIRNHNSNKRK